MHSIINYDPIETLTFVAAHTSRIRLGTGVIDMPYYNPVMLARRLTTLDILSNGRLQGISDPPSTRPSSRTKACEPKRASQSVRGELAHWQDIAAALGRLSEWPG